MTDDFLNDPTKQMFGENFDAKSLLGWIVAEKYRITRHMGSGGFGEVYEAVNIQLLDQRVVIKFLKFVQSRERFEREASILCRLDHPNICRVLDYFPNERALVMLFVNAKDCEELLQEGTGLDGQTVMRVARGVTDAVSYAHSKHIAHRDVKPNNIMIDRFNHVYLIDFGIAKEVDATSLTATGHMVLTPQFAAPERLSPSSPYDPFLSDIYEIGATIYKLATGRTPFELRDMRGLKLKSTYSQKRLSRPLRKVLNKATQRDPVKRYQTADELGRALRTVKQVYARSRFPYVAAAVLLAVVLAYTYSQFHGDLSSVTERLSKLWGATAEQPFERDVTEPRFDSIGLLSDSSVQSEFSLPDSAVTGGPALDASSSVREPKEAKKMAETTPAPLPLPRLTVDVLPSRGAVLYFDGKRVEAGIPHRVKRGAIQVRAILPDHPIVVETLRVTEDISYRIDVSDKTESLASKRLFIGASSPLGSGCLTISLNGKVSTYCRLPVFDLTVIPGIWEMGFQISGMSDPPEIDSLVVFPYDRTGLRQHLSGSNGVIDFARREWRELPKIDMVVYWKE